MYCMYTILCKNVVEIVYKYYIYVFYDHPENLTGLLTPSGMQTYYTLLPSYI